MASINETSSTNDVSVEKVNLKGLLSKVLTLPAYQRRYCWGKEQVSELLADIGKIIFPISNDNDVKPFLPLFLGTVILHQQVNTTESLTHYNLVDGQQRSLTLCLLVMALKEKNQNSSNRIDQLLSKKPLSLLQAKFTHREAQHQLASNFALIKSILSSNQWQLEPSQLDLLFTHCEFVVITINSVDQAFAFFDSQNSAGKRLSDFDLLKARHLRGVVSDPSVGIGCSRIWEEYENLKLNSCYNQRVAYYLTEQLIGRARKRLHGQHGEHLQLTSEFGVRIQKSTETETSSTSNKVQLSMPSNSQLYQNWLIHYHPDKKDVFPFTFETELPLNDGNRFIYSLDDVTELPLQLDQPLIGGEQFFMFIAKYAELYKQLFASDIDKESETSESSDKAEVVVSIQECLLKIHRKQESVQGRGYPRLIQSWQALILFYVDRYGQDKCFNEFVQLSDQYIFSFRILLSQLRRSSIEKKLNDEKIFSRLLLLPTSRETVDYIKRLINKSALELEVSKQKKDKIKGVRKRYLESFYWHQEDIEFSHKKSSNRLSTFLIKMASSVTESTDE
ncbi:DUF262 domain-containing protein [Psychromonas arctica]|uniref:DUF262 domain-containing protein n=1 Tax=Psychromonas arctica TaxID=168275 RepID=UPI00042972E1|nr:DUF262 domain-containing protein [Psychromonas arctica]